MTPTFSRLLRWLLPRRPRPPLLRRTQALYPRRVARLAPFGSWAAWLLATLMLGGAALAQVPGARGTVVTTDQVRAELLAHAPDGIQPGTTFWVGLQLRHIPHWHTYWKNSGDSGLPTTLEWTLPEGISAGEIAWPLPRKIPIGPLANYGYEDTVLLPVPLTVSSQFKAPPSGAAVDIQLRASWLVCSRECIPQDGEFALALPARSSTAGHAAAFAAARAAEPQALPDSADNRVEVAQRSIRLRIHGLPAAMRGKTLDFFPETPEVIETAAPWTQQWEGAVWTAEVPLSPQRSASPELMPVVLAADGQGYRAQARVQGPWPAAAAAAPLSTALQSALDANAAPAAGAGFWAALAGALLGGLILNLMPCVFPVLAIKVAGFARQADDRRAHRISGLAYTAGVLLSFLALGLLLVSLRGAGDSLGWGFQLQSPAVVAALAALFTLIGLNLAGLFSFATFAPSSLAGAHLRHPAADAFLTGVLAVAVASPCTAPFMGASLGLAATLPAVQALAIFAALGLGLALPYLVASLVPAFARALPRPGAWMETLRRLLAFPMFATVAWLVWVLGQQRGIDGAGALLALLVALALAAWTLSLAGRTRLALGGLAILVLAGLGWGLGPYVTRPSEVSASSVPDKWARWEPGRAEQLAAAGRPVFVDFTAAWCVTCQYNKKTTLSDGQLLADMAARNVALLRADWTRRDPGITAALRQLGRNGVPVYVIYRSGKPPLLLSELPSVQEVRDALATL